MYYVSYLMCNVPVITGQVGLRGASWSSRLTIPYIHCFLSVLQAKAQQAGGSMSQPATASVITQSTTNLLHQTSAPACTQGSTAVPPGSVSGGPHDKSTMQRVTSMFHHNFAPGVQRGADIIRQVSNSSTNSSQVNG